MFIIFKSMCTFFYKQRVDILIDEETGGDFKYKSTIDSDVYNKIKLTYDNQKSGKREVYIAKDSKNIIKLKSLAIIFITSLAVLFVQT